MLLRVLNRSCFLIVSLFLKSTSVHGEIFTPDEENRIVEFVNNILDCRHIPGLTLSVVKGTQRWAKGFGYADMAAQRPVDETTVFPIGSLGKAFTMTLLGTFLQQNGYNWTTKISDIEGVNLEFATNELTRNMTVDVMLSHATGLSAVADYGFIGGYPAGTDITFLSKCLKHVPVKSTFRSSFVYNNMMYMILGHVIEVLGRDSWRNLMTSDIYEPIGMSSSSLLDTFNPMAKGAAKPYIYKDGAYEAGTEGIYKISPLEPAGGMISNAVDMATWLMFNLNNGSTEEGSQLLEKQMFLEAFESHNTRVPLFPLRQPKYPMDDITTGYGYAWFDSTYRGHNRKWHSGGLFSYISLLWLYPDEEIGIFTNINGPALPATGQGLKALFYFLSDILLHEQIWLNLTTACTFPEPWSSNFKFEIPKPVKLYGDNLEDYIGTYGNLLLPDVTVEVKPADNDDVNDTLVLSMNRIKGELLVTTEEGRFKFQMSEPWEYAIERVLSENFTLTYPVTFTRNDDGLVIGFNFTLDKPMEFMKGVKFMENKDDINGACIGFGVSILNIGIPFVVLVVLGRPI